MFRYARLSEVGSAWALTPCRGTVGVDYGLLPSELPAKQWLKLKEACNYGWLTSTWGLCPPAVVWCVRRCVRN